MLDLFAIALEAHHDERNHHRLYEVAVGRDLLGDWVVTVRYGRVGGPSRELRFARPDADSACTRSPRSTPAASVGAAPDRVPLPPGEVRGFA